MTEAVNEYLQCLQEERFYDAHEALEALWFPRRFEKSDEVLLLKGFINAAVSFELIKRGRRGPSEKAWNNYMKYLPLLEKITEHRQAFETLQKGVDHTRKLISAS